MSKRELEDKIERLEVELKRLRPDPPDRAWVKDYASINDATIMKHYNLADVKALISWAEPNYAGPLFYTVINGIFAISCLCYGYSHSKRSFLRFLSDNMNIESPFSDLLYSMRQGVKKYGLVWHKGVGIGTGSLDDRLFRVRKPSIIDVNVITLAKLYIGALEQLDTTKINSEMPVSENDIIVAKVIECLERS